MSYIIGVRKRLLKIIGLYGSYTLFFLNRKIPIDDLRKHVYVPARTRHGKTTLIKTVFYNLQKRTQKGRDACLILIDPAGSFAEDVFRFDLNKDMDRVVYIDVELGEKYGSTPTINPMKVDFESQVLKDNFVSVLYSIFNDVMSRGQMSTPMEALISKCLQVLFHNDIIDMFNLYRFYTDDNKDLVEMGRQHPNPVISNYFKSEFFDKNPKGETNMTKQALESRIGKILDSMTTYRLLSGGVTIDLEKLINEGKVIIFNIDNLDPLIGKLIIANIYGIITRRKKSKKNKQVYLFVDEFQNLLLENILEKILSELAGKGLSFIGMHQHEGQVEDVPILKKSMQVNPHLTIVGGTSPSMSSILAKNLGVESEEVHGLDSYNFRVKTVGNEAFQMKTDNFLDWSNKHRLTEKQIIDLEKYQIEKYYKPVEEILEIDKTRKPKYD